MFTLSEIQPQLKLADELDRLREENARLREALERIYNGEPDPGEWWASIAKDALEGK